MRRGSGIVVGLVMVAAVAEACSASNGDAIPSEVRDASALDVGSSTPPPRDGGGSSGGGDDDGMAGDARVDVTDGAADAPTSNVARINELYVDRAVDGDTVEFVEIIGPVGMAVEDLKLRIVDRNGNAKLPVAVSSGPAAIGASGTWVVGGGNVDTRDGGRVDLIVPNSVWGLDNSRGAVQLLRGARNELIDVVGWSDLPDGGAAKEPMSAPTAVYERSPTVLPPLGTKRSFGRRLSGADTNDNSADFCTTAQTPGSSNAACEQ